MTRRVLSGEGTSGGPGSTYRCFGRRHDHACDDFFGRRLNPANSGRFHFDGQGMIGTTLIAFSGEPFTILELTAT